MKRKKSNPISRIPNHPFFRAPKQFPDTLKRAYLREVKSMFKNIISFLQRCNDEDFEPAIKEDQISRIISFQNVIINALTEYLNGHPSIAYELFSEGLKSHNIDQELQSVQLIKVESGTIFFRTQRDYQGNRRKKKLLKSDGFLNLKKPLELFHPPFERRRSVSSNRFSISGYPSLYLSKTIHTSFSECYPKKNKGCFHAIGLKNIRPLYFIDLTENTLSLKNDLFEGVLPKKKIKTDVSGILEHLGLYQLILATHTKVSYKELYKNEIPYFKAEYIVPQLLLQWVKIEGLAIDGIRYHSCTGSIKFKTIKEQYNYVLPVKSNLEKGYCDSLKSLFKVSKVYSCLKDNGKIRPMSDLKKVEGELIRSDYTALSQLK